MYVVTVRIDVVPEHVIEFAEAMEIQARTSFESESGCLQFDVSYDIDNPEVCFLYEVYSDKAAFDEHLNSDRFLAYSELVENWIRTKSIACYKKAWPT